MSQVFRYPLTRFCLRAGTLTLPRVMVGLFPEDGDSVVVDTSTGEEFTVTTANARTVGGFASFFKRHQLAVNDELLIEALDDGTFAVTATTHASRTEDREAAAVRRVLDELHEAAVPVTEGEIRALFPDLPTNLDLVEALEADGRFSHRQGRWHDAAAVDAVEAAGRVSAGKTTDASRDDSDVTRGEDAVTAEADLLVVAVPPTDAASAAADHTRRPPADATPHQQNERQRDPQHAVGDQPRTASDPAGSNAIAQHLGAAPADAGAAMQAGLWSSVSDAGTAHDSGPAAAGAGSSSQRSVFERRTPVNAAAPQRREDAEDDDGASLEATELSNRLRAALAPLGFRLEPLALGQLNVHADMGRRSYRVLVQLLCRSKRLDWADLLARRRTSGVRYLAVFGDHRDLLRLTNPADLARATLWSWQALDRMTVLHRSVPLSPVELEAHFERDGLFEQGLKRLEDTVAQRVGERGAMSEVLARLAVMRSPAVFLLEELAGELGMSRELALRILERLGDAPFHLVAKVDAGEFVLRQSVGDALEKVAGYASSLRERLPVKQVERLVASGEPDLLTDADALDHMLNAGNGAEA